MEKFCNTCQTTKPVTEFHKRGDKWQPRCKLCAKSKQADRYSNFSAEQKEHRAKLVNARTDAIKAEIRLMKSEPCTDCHNCYPYYVMDYDHIGTDKSFGIAQALVNGFSRERILAEIAKCELVCSNCHRIRTHTRKPV